MAGSRHRVRHTRGLQVVIAEHSAAGDMTRLAFGLFLGIIVDAKITGGGCRGVQ
jgi:hypothetical protein